MPWIMKSYFVLQLDDNRQSNQLTAKSCVCFLFFSFTKTFSSDVRIVWRNSDLLGRPNISIWKWSPWFSSNCCECMSFKHGVYRALPYCKVISYIPICTSLHWQHSLSKCCVCQPGTSPSPLVALAPMPSVWWSHLKKERQGRASLYTWNKHILKKKEIKSEINRI